MPESDNGDIVVGVLLDGEVVDWADCGVDDVLVGVTMAVGGPEDDDIVVYVGEGDVVGSTGKGSRVPGIE